MNLYVVTGGGAVLLVRAKTPEVADKIGRKRLFNNPEAAKDKKIDVKQVDITSETEEVVLKLMPRE